jgi:hypothetical protein
MANQRKKQIKRWTKNKAANPHSFYADPDPVAKFIIPDWGIKLTPA